jgi:signal transduction histidine kinase
MSLTAGEGRVGTGTAAARASREDQLAEWVGRLIRRNQALDDFAALVAHELKDQLFAAAISSDPRAILRALDLIDELLEAARNEGDDAWAEAPRGLDDAVRDLSHRPATIESRLPDAFPMPQTLLRVVLRNLIANAVAAGARTVRVTSGSSDRIWRLTVDDDGRGLAAEPGDRPGRHGVGLALCRRIAERRGGSLELEDSPMGGARATMTIPGRLP